MFDYKSPDFYTDYFNNSPDFCVVTPFEKSKEKGEDNLIVGYVEVINTIHPLLLRVEIPTTFPHNKLTFKTKSLYGYPHLIHSGKVENGDWFCLNTPFAETATEQLNQEVHRLKEWISHQMREDLPAKIEDTNVIKALRVANAYEWENPDEVKEFSSKAILTFVGEGFSNSANFQTKKGHFDGIRTPDNRIYAFLNKRGISDYKLPYIIVTEWPKDTSVFEDFIKMKSFFKWDEETCHHLLSGSNYHSGKSVYSSIGTKYEVEYSVEEALQIIESIKKELNNQDSYLDKSQFEKRFDKNKTDSKRKVKPSHKPLILSELAEIKKQVISDNGISYVQDRWNRPVKDVFDDEYEEEDALIEQWVEHDQYIYDYFLVGFEIEGTINWLLFFTNPASVRYDQTTYDVGIKEISVSVVTSFSIDFARPQYVDETMFFGRGALCQNLIDKRIALVGLGAIGSMVAESLAHSGIRKIGLWDSDIVEPGNICRSSYRLDDLGNSKVGAIKSKIMAINPFIEISEIKGHGHWGWNPNWSGYSNGSFYDNVNYKSQEESIKELDGYDIIIDCTGSNEMLHFLSYAITDKEIIGLCITNHANDLICTTNFNGNPFELRKAYLSRIAQDTKNFYVEGSGCYSPTFLAKYFDIASLVNYFVRDLDKCTFDERYVPSCIYSYRGNGILKDEIVSYTLDNYGIILNISRETLLDAEDMFDAEDVAIGYILGCYSANGKEIMITQIVPYNEAELILKSAYANSKGIIDYIGDFVYSAPESDKCPKESFENILAKAVDPEINTNNPLLALKQHDGTISFMLLLNGELEPFTQRD
ncbi:MAG: ThiF family adenylyltransferase [Muribaculum sp.]|nr:ThiF family adenylyltransferase [Muribaculum sp.]